MVDITKEFDSFIKTQIDLLKLTEEVMAYVHVRLPEPEYDIDTLADYNHRLYEDILPENYGESYANPDFACEMFGDRLGKILTVIAAEVRAAIPLGYEGSEKGLGIRKKLIEDAGKTGPDAEKLEKLMAAYLADNFEDEIRRKTGCLLIPGCQGWIGDDFADTDESTLYLTGEYVGSNEISMYRYLESLPEESLLSMAQTYVNGFVKGFEVTGRDLSIKDTAELRFNIGFIPMMRYAARLMHRAGLDITVCRAGYSIFTGRSAVRNGAGFTGGCANPQYDYDHKDDAALFMTERYNSMRISALESAYSGFKDQARAFAGPAVVETFGEKPFEPVEKASAVHHSDESRKLVTAYSAKAGALVNRYIPGDERSFTIIAYPVPEIGSDFEDIMRDTIRINTLDYVLYRDIQQKMIDVLDTAEYVSVRGTGVNHTDLMVHLHEITDPDKQTKFENCVADVNIPVGEVFTSPVLAGTNGVLHVSKVFLNGLEYRNLELKITNGMIMEYSCDNGKKLIEDNILYHHDTLPMGECAIGTNTTAYTVARKYNIEALMPILIAEKTGPHFAFGDTCYSHCEDLAVYNPDGKEIIARDNECSLKRKTDMSAAYFNCHTDITIPYDELGELSAVRAGGEHIPIIINGRFVLPGCEALNEPLTQADK